MPDAMLLNPEDKLMPDVAGRLSLFRKTKPVWATRLAAAQMVETIEGPTQANAGDYLCRGILKEQWAQREAKILEKYTPSGELDQDGWERFDPKPDAPAVAATQLDVAFRVKARWGMLTGKPGDYIVRSTTDQSDIWIVDQAIFEASYSPERP